MYIHASDQLRALRNTARPGVLLLLPAIVLASLGVRRPQSAERAIAYHQGQGIKLKALKGRVRGRLWSPLWQYW